MAAPELDEWVRRGRVWYPCVSADGRQRFDGTRWAPIRAGWRLVRYGAIAMLALTPVVVLVAFGYVAGEPEYAGQPEPPHERLVADVSLAWAPCFGLLLWLASRRVGAPGFRSRKGSAGWRWTPPPGWPTPPAGWQPEPGWVPPDDWPDPPLEWRGWRREE